MKNILVISYIPVVRMYDEILYSVPNTNVKCIEIFGKYSVIRRLCIICLWLSLDRLIFSIVFKEINLKEYDLIVINEMKYSDKLTKWIRQYTNSPVVYQLWNTISKIPKSNYVFFNIYLLSKKYNVKIYSSDKNDCKKYGLNYKKQFIPWFVSKIKNDEYDMLFIGRDKGRLETLIDLKNEVNRLGIKCLFLIYDDAGIWKIYSDYFVDMNMLSGFMSYEKVVSFIKKSRIIVDLVQPGQNGLTWRPIEAMIYDKKLVTNFISIKTENFYNKQNVFIINHDDIESFREFVSSDVLPVDDEIKREYTFTGWLENYTKS